MRTFTAKQITKRAGVYRVSSVGAVRRVVTVPADPMDPVGVPVSLMISAYGAASRFNPEDWSGIKFVEADPICLHFGPDGSSY